MNKKLFSLFMFSCLFLLAGCNNDSSIITHTRPADWTANRTMSYLNHFRPAINFSKNEVKDMLHNTPYYKINNMIYNGDDITKTYIENSDVDSFFPLIGDYGLDNYALYIAGIRYPVDTGSLIIYRNFGYIASSGIVYWIGNESNMKPLSGVNPEKFTTLSFSLSSDTILYSSIYAKDDKFIYHQGDILSGADYDTFELTSPGTGQDKNHTYRNGKIVE